MVADRAAPRTFFLRPRKKTEEDAPSAEVISGAQQQPGGEDFMAGAQPNPILRLVRRLAPARAPGDEADRQLLRRFVNEADEGAFQALVRRHGPLVMSVCARVLRSEHDAEDAFQATFLVLVRKAASIRTPELLGPWLYGVAYRTALKAKAEALRRRQRETRLMDTASPPAADNLTWRDLRPVLDEEVHRLPHKYRVPFVLCYLEGKTNEQAAQILGCPPGTVFSRLAWARERLRRQLGRRGLALSAGVLAVVLSQRAVAAAVPDPLVVLTCKAARAFAAGKAAAAAGTAARAAALAEGVLRAMFLTKLKIAVVVLLAAAVAGTTAGVLTHQALAREPAGRKNESAARDAEQPKADKDKLRGTWIPVYVQQGGKRVPEDEVKAKNFEMVFTADKVNLPIKEESKEAGYKLDPDKTPKQIDLFVGDGKVANKGIYLLEEDKLKLCIATEPGAERPTEFVTKEGTNYVLIVLKMKK
jgi:RNA polymerase sigma factor (sigma-70 family)